MIKGLVGEKLLHSYSKIIHEQIDSEIYNLYSLSLDEFNRFFTEKNFDFVNVTIPYKEKVIPYLDEISSEALSIQAVNLVINDSGKLYGYNTDYYGFKYMLESNNVIVKDKKCLILGTGGTSKTVKAVLEDLGAALILKASRNVNESYISYEQVYEYDFNIIINTTPVGMYPNFNSRIIDISKFNSLDFVGDCIYNPLRTGLLIDCEYYNIKCDNGLKMLIVQAIKAHEIAMNTDVSKEKIDEIFNLLVKEKRNIALIGMPGSGKTTIANILSEKLNKKIIDIDKYIIEKENMSIEEIFNKNSEQYFRKLENIACKEISQMSGVIISTGGGVVKNKENIDFLKANCVIYFINRSVDNIYDVLVNNIKNDKNRPLLKSKDDLMNLYNQRIDLYKKYSDYILDNNGNIENCINDILKKEN